MENQLKSEYVAVSFNNEPKEILNTKQTVTPTYKGDDYTAKEAYVLTNGELKGGEEINYTIKLWLDESVTSIDSMNKEFISKISISGELKSVYTLVEYLKNLESDELVEDDFGNLRYVGKNPNNYVSFNNELWRIIGVMKDIENPDGTKEDKVKLIRNEQIGSFKFEDSDISSSNWSTSPLKTLLNDGDYYNRTNTFQNRGLTNEAKNMISESIWNLGGITKVSEEAKKIYEQERGEEVFKGHATKWTGSVGLMYPSDYGYATSGGETTDRVICLSDLYNWLSVNWPDCKNNNWLYSSRINQWTLTHSNNNFANIMIYVSLNGSIMSTTTSDSEYSRPVVYLKSNIGIIGINEGNDGSSTSPFILKQS